MNKRWADITDDDPIEPYDMEVETVEVSKHGIKVKKSAPYLPPHHRQDKTKQQLESKK